jgi:hypothetical protein
LVVLTKRIAAADYDARRLTGIFFILRRITDGGELKHAVVRTEHRVPRDHDVRSDEAARPDLDVRTDDRVGPNLDAIADLGRRRHDGARVDICTHVELPGATMSSQEAAWTSPTCAAASNFQMPRICRCSVAVRIS